MRESDRDLRRFISRASTEYIGVKSGNQYVPFDNNHGNKHGVANRTEAVALQKGHQEAESYEDHNSHVAHKLPIIHHVVGTKTRASATSLEKTWAKRARGRHIRAVRSTIELREAAKDKEQHDDANL